MISAEVEGIKIIPLTPGFISSEQRKDPTQQESKTVGSPKDRAKEFVDGLRHHWKLNFPESTDTAVREELLAARERGELVIYRRGGLRRKSIKLAGKILSTTREGERFTDGADFKETTSHVVTHPILVWRFRNSAPDIYFAADLRDMSQYRDNPPKRMRKPRS